ncbi:MAG TPA: DNA polymerase ligase N-terminal domain-containing protein, partial [Candidatus Eisenbacteria bacterium]|nr:DNA polymerase ligase N-terminal domain-containing protein [Candidatus Eisenbacteria bacterium]
MPLTSYRKKRDFRRTPEPKGQPKTKTRGASARGKLRFVIQKHAATRLHYDFRLELDGVLKSWAVPKGPSLDPSEKRLAVEVEDHPIEYGGFEGIIPKGQYGGGTVLLWDRGTWTPVGDPVAGLRKGHLAFELHGKKLEGGFHLVRLRGDDGDKKNWLLMKQKDEFASPESRGSVVEKRPESVKSGRTIEQIADARRSRVWNSNRAEDSESPKPRTIASKARATTSGTRRSTRRATKAQGPAFDGSTLSGAREAPMPRRMEMELCTLVSKAPEGDDWLHEIKYDGYR